MNRQNTALCGQVNARLPKLSSLPQRASRNVPVDVRTLPLESLVKVMRACMIGMQDIVNVGGSVSDQQDARALFAKFEQVTDELFSRVPHV